ncbi:MAG: winged helix-turn-helix transcriptional regulator [Candidatus Zambryskibacteria bacterium]|nr:winged helix-turn-helix transcriptional regulator [Candidatus Zambryskibacteria bacterium]
MYYVFTLVAGILIGYLIASKRRKASFISKQQEEKRQNKQAIYELLETNHPLTNNDVEAMLGISDATATRYFDELEKEGKVKQVGKTGRHVSYERV